MLNRAKFLLIFLFSYNNHVLCEYLDLREGTKCSWSNETGVCVSYYNCFIAQDGMPGEDKLPICSYDGDVPIVCCNDCYTSSRYDVRDETYSPYVGILNNYHGSISRTKFNEFLANINYPCRRYLTTALSWSYDSNLECQEILETQSGTSEGIDFPRDPGLIQTVLLGYGQDLETAQWLCGGSIISENYILTSANCTARPPLGEVKFVAIGPLKGMEKPLQTHRVAKIIVHPEFRPPSKYHDIALLKTATEIQFSEQVAPFAVDPGNAPEPYFAVAWSQLGKGKSLTETLESASLTHYVFEYENCPILFPPQAQLKTGYNYTIQLCLTYQGERTDICEGNSGGSVQSMEDKNCTYNVLGLTTMCRVSSVPGAGGAALYTRIRYYEPWIESIVWPGPHLSNTKQNEKLILSSKFLNL